MHPVLFQYKFIAIYSYGALLAIAFLLGIVVASFRGKRKGYDPNQIVDFSLIILIASVVGARLLYVGMNWDYYRYHLVETVMIQKGGLIFYGGLILGVLGALLFIRLKKWNRWQVADIMAPSIALGQAFGRVGCFLNGCCFGTLTSFPWGVQFPDESPASVEFGPLHLVHPVQLYATAAHLIFFVFLLWFDKRSRFDGQTFTVYMIGYGLIRFGLEFLRGDNPSLLGFLTLSQIISVVIFGSGLFLYKMLSRKNRFHAENV